MCNVLLITCGSVSNIHREINKVREMRLKKGECNRLRRENETSEERQYAKFENLVSSP